MHVSSSPPLRTGLATLTAPGSAPLSTLHGMTMKRRCPLLPVPRGPHPWTACACTGDLGCPLLTGSGPSPSGLLLRCTAGPCADSSAPADAPLRQRAVVRRCPLPPSPLLLASLEEPPVFRLADSHRTLEVACPSPGPVPSLWLPSLGTEGKAGGPLSPWPSPGGIALVLPRSARVGLQARLADLVDKGGQGQR